MGSIDSVKDPVVQEVRALATGAGRRREGRCVAEGARLVSQLLEGNVPVHAILVTAAGAPDALVARAAACGVAVHTVKPGVLRHAVGTPATCVAVCPLPAERTTGAPVATRAIVCDGVADPGNLGAIVRSAVALGPAAVVFTGDEDPGSRRMIDASRGSVLVAELHRRASAAEAVAELRAAGWWAVASGSTGAVPLGEVAMPDGPVALVVGSETRGVARTTAAACDATVSIALPGPVESLNVAVAAGIGLWALRPPGPAGDTPAAGG